MFHMALLVVSDTVSSARHQAITWTYADLSSKVFCGTHLGPNSHEVLMNLICNMSVLLLLKFCQVPQEPLQWRHNEYDGVSNHQRIDCLLNRLFRRRSKKHQSSASLAFVRGIHRWPVKSPHKGPVTRKIQEICQSRRLPDNSVLGGRVTLSHFGCYGDH